MFDEVLEAADRLADAVRECEMPADDEALRAGVRAAVVARNAADGLLAQVTGEIDCRNPARPRFGRPRADRGPGGDGARGGGCPQIPLAPQIAGTPPDRGC
jgi:hypothetical protein